MNTKSDTPSKAVFSPGFIGILGAILIGGLIVVRGPLFESLWLDETITYWLINSESIEACFDRAWFFQAQSPLYFIFMWFWGRAVGFEEFILRVPSILAVVATVFLLIHSSKRMKLEGGWYIIPLVFLSVPSVYIQAFSARPYALGIFFTTLSIYSLLQWLATNKFRYQFFYIISSLLTFYLHYVFSIVGIIHLLIFCLSIRTKQVSTRNVIGTLFVMFILCVPGFIHIDSWSSRSDILDAYGDVTAKELWKNIFPVELLIYIVFGLAIALIYERLSLRKIDNSLKILVIFWTFLPTVVLFLMSLFLEKRMFMDKYFVWRVSGLSLLVVAFFNAISPKKAWVLVLSVWILMGVILESMRIWNVEKWRQTAVELNLQDSTGNVPVLVYPGLIELHQPDFYKTIDLRTDSKEYLTAPFQVYAKDRKLFPMPNSFKEEFIEYKKLFLDGYLRNVDEFFFVGFERGKDIIGNRFKEFISNNTFGDSEWRVLEEKTVGNIKVLRYNKIHNNKG